VIIKSRRYGKILITKETSLEDQARILRELQCVIRCEFLYERAGFFITAISDQFEEIEERCEPLIYTIEKRWDGKIIFKE
jgi:hypothetical protein